MSAGPSRRALVCAALGTAIVAGPLCLAHTVMAQAITPVGAASSGLDPALEGLALPNLAMAPTADLKIKRTGGREHLRFTTTLVNLGEGPLIVSARRVGPRQPWAVLQQFLDPEGAGERTIPLELTPNWGGDGHNHWHVPDVAHYRLLRLSDSGEAVRNHKISFCLFDSVRHRRLPTDPSAPGFPTDAGCARGDFEATSFRMGISAGFGDVYQWRLPGQSVDITELPAGDYRLEGKVNGLGVLFESDAADNLEWVDFRLTRAERRTSTEILGRGSSAAAQAVPVQPAGGAAPTGRPAANSD